MSAMVDNPLRTTHFDAQSEKSIDQNSVQVPQLSQGLGALNMNKPETTETVASMAPATGTGSLSFQPVSKYTR
jgi:hypothetical protein